MAVKETYYVKRGRKYVPVSDYDSEISYSLKYGTHLVVNHLGCRMYMYDVEPDKAAIIAAARIFKEYLAKSLFDASQARPKTGAGVPFTKKQQQAYNKLKKELGEHTYYFEFPSMYDIVNKGVEEFIKYYADKYKDYPFVKKAYDNFLLKCDLCIDKAE